MRTRGHRTLAGGGSDRRWNAHSERVCGGRCEISVTKGECCRTTRSECAFHLEEFYDAG